MRDVLFRPGGSFLLVVGDGVTQVVKGCSKKWDPLPEMAAVADGAS